jgi:glycosyltransferase involved in cell wall biosynthesis
VSATLLGAPQPQPVSGDEREPFWLFVGGTEERKNLARVLEAFDADELASTRLKVVGHTAASAHHQDPAALVAPLRAETRARVDWLGHVPDAELESLYGRALALVYPSLYEGYGLPVLEAMARGTPVITSTVASLPEAAGDAALLVDPRDAAATRAAMRRLAEEPGLAAEQSRLGLAHAAERTWEATARATLDVYEGVLR